ncbi:MAG: site-specific tyrosine recombinase XerD [Actinobacteria bacterium]|nr:site-specific tyrosine recombinase XerD [Actinomycetota bacterium]
MNDSVFQKERAAFLDYLRVEKGLAENSVNAYRRDLTRLSAYLAERGISAKSLSSHDLRDFQTSLRVQRLSDASINRSMSAMRTFFKWLAVESKFADPTVDLEKSKQVRRLPKALSVQEMISLIEAAFQEGDAVSLRDRALLELLYGTGGRVSEIVNLDLSDLHQFVSDGLKVETVKLLGKGGKERIAPLGSYASKALQDYLTRTRPLLAQKSKKQTSALFLNQRGSRLSRQSAWRFVAAAAERAGLTQKVSPHVFRHSFATHLLDGGADIRVVQELLGHASVTTTQIYTLITIDKVRETYSLAHPRARD